MILALGARGRGSDSHLTPTHMIFIFLQTLKKYHGGIAQLEERETPGSKPGFSKSARQPTYHSGYCTCLVSRRSRGSSPAVGCLLLFVSLWKPECASVAEWSKATDSSSVLFWRRGFEPHRMQESCQVRVSLVGQDTRGFESRTRNINSCLFAAGLI